MKNLKLINARTVSGATLATILNPATGRSRRSSRTAPGCSTAWASSSASTSSCPSAVH